MRKQGYWEKRISSLKGWITRYKRTIENLEENYRRLQEKFEGRVDND